MASVEVQVAGSSFIVYILFAFYFLHDFNLKEISLVSYRILGLVVISSSFFCLPYSGVLKRSALLGFICGTGFYFSFSSDYYNLRSVGWYLCALSFFHFSEYIMTALYNADKLSIDSFLLNHSKEYKLAAVASWIEFLIELFLFPALKTKLLVSFLGLVMVVFGETLRKVAMMTAKSNFTHLVQFKKRENHVLVTSGIYGWCRHPAYVGWFWWSIGTQLILCNPICFICYLAASWKFFKERIWDEEASLLSFFGEEYINYQRRVGTGLPFINGLLIDKNIEQLASRK